MWAHWYPSSIGVNHYWYLLVSLWSSAFGMGSLITFKYRSHLLLIPALGLVAEHLSNGQWLCDGRCYLYSIRRCYLGLWIQPILGLVSLIRGHTAWSMECLHHYGSQVPISIMFFFFNRYLPIFRSGLRSNHGSTHREEGQGHVGPFVCSGACCLQNGSEWTRTMMSLDL